MRLPFFDPRRDEVAATATDLITRFGLHAHHEASYLAELSAQMHSRWHRVLYGQVARDRCELCRGANATGPSSKRLREGHEDCGGGAEARQRKRDVILRDGTTNGGRTHWRCRRAHRGRALRESASASISRPACRPRGSVRLSMSVSAPFGRGTRQRVLRLRERLGGEEDPAPHAASPERRGFGWARWSRGWLYQTLKLFNGYQVVRPAPKAAPAG
jgi:hypothetical protein